MARILIIDDEEIVRRSMKKILEVEGHDVLEAKSGIDGLLLAKSSQPDLLITDIFMPDKDGLEVIQELRKENTKIKILAMTGGGMAGNLDFLPQAKAFGAHDTLHKPFTRDKLIQVINAILA